MKKYYLSHIDFSEIINVTTDEAQLFRARERMLELGMLTEKGRPSTTALNSMVRGGSEAFFIKLQKRLRRRNGGAAAVKDTLKMLCDRKDYYGFFLYIAFLYGFVEWQVPERVTLLPAAPDALKYYCNEFVAAFDVFLGESTQEEREETDFQADA